MLSPVLALTLLSATPVQPGEVYAEGTRVGFEQLGLSFVIPRGARGRLTPDGGAFLMGFDAAPGLLIGVAEPDATLAGLEEALSSPLPLDAATVLQPAGRARQRSGTVTNRYTVTSNGQTFTGAAKARLLGGVGVGFVSVAPSAKVAQRRLAEIFASLKTVPKPEPGRSSGPWAQRLKGNTLTYMKTANGLSTEKHIQLCPSGRFVYSGSESYLSGDFSAAGQGGNQGTWQLTGDTLVLTWSDGSLDRRHLSRQGGKTLVDGTRWFIERGTSCQ